MSILVYNNHNVFVHKGGRGVFCALLQFLDGRVKGEKMDNTQMDALLNGIDFSNLSALEELAEAGFDKNQAKTVVAYEAVDTALSVAHGADKEDLADFVSELNWQNSGNYDIAARFEAVPEKPHFLDKARTYVGTTIDELKAAFNDKRFGKAALAGTKVVLVVGGIGLVAYVLFGNVQAANADMINPLDHVASDSPIDTVVFNSGYGNGTGAGAVFPHDMNSNEWLASMDSGFLLKYDGKTFQGSIDTGISGLTGVDYLSADDIVLSAGTTLYFGNISGGTWNQTTSLDLTLVSDITDVADGQGLADLFVPTASDGVYAIRNGALGEQIDSANVQAYDVIKLDPTAYTNDMGQFQGQVFKLLDENGVPLGGSGNTKTINLFPNDTITGVAHIQDGLYLIQPEEFQRYKPQQYAEGIVPEPGTAALLAIGGMYFLIKKRNNRE